MINNFNFCPLCKEGLRKKRIDGRYRKFCPSCKWICYENPLPVVVCAAINRKNELLIAKRNLDPGMGKWSLPGGFVETNETPEAACLRELIEETGIKGKIIRLLGVYVQETKKYGSLLIIGYAVKVSKENITINNEVKEAKFTSRKKLPWIPFSTHRELIKQIYKRIN